MNMNAVGIDVSKRKSTVCILRSGGEVVSKPFEITHSSEDILALVDRIDSLDGETRIVMECTGHYYEPLARELTSAGLFVSAVNPQLIRNYQDEDNALRRVKSDKADSIKIARYTLDRWAKLRQYASKHGSPVLRKTLFQIMDVLIKTKPQDDPVYLFMDKKRSEGKPYYVYMTAGANKFLRIYYGRVKEYLGSLPQ